MSEVSIQKHGALPKKYTFVKKGDQYVTRSCTTEAKNDGHDVFIVHDGPTRIGIGVPAYVVRAVREQHAETAGRRADQRAVKLQKEHEAAAAALVRLFPNFQLPVADLLKAWDVGSGRVGRTAKLDLDRKVELAAIAVARHRFTQYDALLREGVPREEARRLVRGNVNKTLELWKKNGSNLISKGKAQVPAPVDTEVAGREATPPRLSRCLHDSLPPTLVDWPSTVLRAVTWVGELSPKYRNTSRIDKYVAGKHPLDVPRIRKELLRLAKDRTGYINLRL